jgi:hypothetical protein
MASEDAVKKALQGGFRHARTYPDLPPGYDWETQKKKYCQGNLWDLLRTYRYADTYENMYAGDVDPRRRIPQPKHGRRNKFGYVFCHRGLYDRALGYPENSLLAVENGLRQGLYFHELDGNIAQRPYERWKLFIAHDRVPSRVTSKTDTWSTYKLSSLMETALVTRRFDLEKGTFATSYLGTDTKIPFLTDLDPAFSEKDGLGTKYLQIDLRGRDLADGISAFYHSGLRDDIRIILKGYNVEFPTLADLEAGVKQSNVGYGPMTFHGQAGYPLVTIMVFYSYPIVNLALKARGIDPDTATSEQKLSISYREFYDRLMTQVQSFTETNLFQFIFEIVHSGLGLGYDVRKDTAKNPLDGTAITDPEVLFECRVDRAMLEVGLALRNTPNPPYFSSCTRLCDVRTSREEMNASFQTGHMRVIPKGQKGLQTKIRAMHGGMYPQSDLVVADDPLAEIAARTWIDEYAKLDRKQLMQGMPYDLWLEQGGEPLVTAVKKLNGPFMPNTFDGPMDEYGNIIVPNVEIDSDPPGQGRQSKSASHMVDYREAARHDIVAPHQAYAGSSERPSGYTSHSGGSSYTQRHEEFHGHQSERYAPEGASPSGYTSYPGDRSHDFQAQRHNRQSGTHGHEREHHHGNTPHPTGSTSTYGSHGYDPAHQNISQPAGTHSAEAPHVRREPERRDNDHRLKRTGNHTTETRGPISRMKNIFGSKSRNQTQGGA